MYLFPIEQSDQGQWANMHPSLFLVNNSPPLTSTWMDGKLITAIQWSPALCAFDLKHYSSQRLRNNARISTRHSHPSPVVDSELGGDFIFFHLWLMRQMCWRKQKKRSTGKRPVEREHKNKIISKYTRTECSYSPSSSSSEWQQMFGSTTESSPLSGHLACLGEKVQDDFFGGKKKRELSIQKLFRPSAGVRPAAIIASLPFPPTSRLICPPARLGAAVRMAECTADVN